MILTLFDKSNIFADDTTIDKTHPYPLAKDFWGIEVGKNFPAGATADILRSDQRNFFLTYYHVLDRNWTVGLNGGFRSLALADSSDKFAIFSLSNFAYRAVRLYHPLNLWVGGKWLYLMPVRDVSFPFKDYDEYQAEIGISASLMLTYVWSTDILITLRADRWRGTNTNRLHGYEVSMGSAFEL